LSPSGKRARVATDWLLDVLMPRQAIQLGLVCGQAVALENTTPEIPVTPRSAADAPDSRPFVRCAPRSPARVGAEPLDQVLPELDGNSAFGTRSVMVSSLDA